MKMSKVLGTVLAMGVTVFGFGTVSHAINTTQVCEFNGHYYQAVDADVTFEQAEYQCEKVGAHLVTITSKEEQDFVYSLTGKSDVFIGGKLVDGKWCWVTGEPFEYTNWLKDQPSGGADEKYLEFWQGQGGWDDVKATTQGYVMEWDTAQAYQEKTPNYISKVSYQGHSYMYVPGGYTWTEAKKLCEKMGGYLVTVTSEGENNFVYNLTNGTNTWIGLNNAKKKSKYVWVTGERADYLKFGEHVNAGYNGEEKYFGFYEDSGKEWNDYREDEPNMAFICEWDDQNPIILTKVKSSLTVKKGKKASLKYQLYPVKTKLTFKSSNKKVATVDKKGVVTGKKKGNTKITIKAKNKKLTIKVKVK